MQPRNVFHFVSGLSSSRFSCQTLPSCLARHKQSKCTLRKSTPPAHVERIEMAGVTVQNYHSDIEFKPFATSPCQSWVRKWYLNACQHSMENCLPLIIYVQWKLLQLTCSKQRLTCVTCTWVYQKAISWTSDTPQCMLFADNINILYLHLRQPLQIL